MTVEDFIEKVRCGERVTFPESIAVIAEFYEYFPTQFTNGLGESRLVNEAGSNEGSCRIFYFAWLNGLSEQNTLSLFGDYYWKDVLDSPDGSNHPNIRTFMQFGWQGINFDSTALKPKNA